MEMEKKNRLKEIGKKLGDWRRRLGAHGEDLAAAALRRKGMRIIERNFRCRLGEIDVVAEDGETVVFVEVKGKSGPNFGRPEEMVTPAKQRRLTALARHYLQRRQWHRRPARFDVVAICWKDSRRRRVTHYRNAFPACGGW